MVTHGLNLHRVNPSRLCKIKTASKLLSARNGIFKAFASPVKQKVPDLLTASPPPAHFGQAEQQARDTRNNGRREARAADGRDATSRRSGSQVRSGREQTG